jgi:hypothetical protein
MQLTTARLAAAAALCLAPLVARAEPDAAQAAQATQLFNDGKQLMGEGKLAEACAAFDASQKLAPATSTLLNQADCREKNHQLATAWGLFLEAERDLRTGDAQLHQVAADRAAKLEKKVPKLTIHVADGNRVDKLEIKRGSDVVDPSTWNHALPIDGGTYKISAHAPGMTDWSQNVDVGNEGDEKTVEVPKLAAAVDTNAEPPKETPAPVAPRSKTLPIALGAGAVVLLGGALGFDLWGDSTYDQSKKEPDPMKQDDLWHSANDKRYVAEGLAVAGIGCAGVAVWLFLKKDPAPESSRSVRVEPTVTHDHAFVMLTGRF